MPANPPSGAVEAAVREIREARSKVGENGAPLLPIISHNRGSRLIFLSPALISI